MPSGALTIFPYIHPQNPPKNILGIHQTVTHSSVVKAEGNTSNTWKTTNPPLIKLTPLHRQSSNTAHVITSTISVCPYTKSGPDGTRGYFSPYSQSRPTTYFFSVGLFSCTQNSIYAVESILTCDISYATVGSIWYFTCSIILKTPKTQF